jgi:hypothetical protein
VTAVDVTGRLADCDQVTVAAVKSVFLFNMVIVGQEGGPIQEEMDRAEHSR